MAVVGEADIVIGADSAKFAGDLAMLASGMLPVLASATVGLIGLTGAIAGAGAALGVFGAVAFQSFKDLKEQTSTYQTLQAQAKAYGEKAAAAQKAGDTKGQTAALKSQAQALEQLKALMASLPPEQKAAMEGYIGMQTAWKGFVKDNSPETYGIMAQGFALINSSISQLQPLFDVGASAVRRLLIVAQAWVDRGGLKGLVDYLATQGQAAVGKFGSLFANLGRILGNVFGQIGAGGGGQGMLDWLVEITDRFANWTGGQGFTDFLDKTAEGTPHVTQLLGSLAQNVGVIAQALTPLAPISIAVATALSALINAVPVPVITAVVGAFIAFSLAMKAYNAAMIIAAAATLLYQGVLYVISGLIRAWTAAQWLLNAALTLNPIGLVVLAIAALVAIIVLIATKTTWFQDIWAKAWPIIQTVFTVTWNVIKAVAEAVWNFIATKVQNTIKDITGYVNAVKTAITVAFNATKTAVLAAWDAIKGAASTAWNAVKSAAVTVLTSINTAVANAKSTISAAWESMKTTAVNAWNTIKSTVTGAWDAVKSATTTAMNAVKDAVSTGIATVKTKFNEIKTAIQNIDLTAAGRALIQGFINGIKGAMGGAVDAVAGGLAKIKNLLPGSPIKEGPLVGWNNGGAGKRLMDLVADGINANSGVVSGAATAAVGGVAQAMNGGGAAGGGALTSVGDTYIDVRVAVDDLEKMKTVGDFIDMLKDSRATARRTQRSGTVTA